MAFAVVCKSCQARFLLNDDLLRRRVAGKVVTVRCRQCHAAIEVDASDVDPKSLPPHKVEPPPQRLAAPEPVKPGTPVTSMTFKPAPAPPRPVKSSTLMGIGGPPRPSGATELVALSPGFLSVSGNTAAAPAKATRHGFPEPPPPPGAVEELNSGDWEIPDSKPQAAAAPKADAAPESLDDFVEELPPSLPAPAPTAEEEVPSSTGTPSLKALTHHDEHAPKPRIDDFFANMSAAMNGGVLPDAAGGAPTIDVSALAAEVTPTTSEVDVPDFDVPLGNAKATLPLFALGSDTSSLLTAPAAPIAPVAVTPAAKPLSPSPADGSLRPSTVDRPVPSSQRPDSERTRERKNVVAPATKSVPPPGPAQRRSGLAAPVLLALAAAAGFLIWKRSATTQAPPLAEPAPAAVAAGDKAPEPAVAAPPAAVAPAPELAPVASVAAAATADDISFTTTPSKLAAPAVVTHDKPTESAPATPAAAKPTEPATPAVAAAPKPEPAAPAIKEEPKPEPAEPAPPAEPAGPFDRAAAAAALTAASGQASACRKDGDPSGVASVVITFAPSGRVTSANVSGPPFAGTPTGGCIAAALRKAKIPAFDGDRVTVSKTIVIQ